MAAIPRIVSNGKWAPCGGRLPLDMEGRDEYTE
jgi:hypothetical protein